MLRTPPFRGSVTGASAGRIQDQSQEAFSSALLAVPVGLFAAAYTLVAPPPAAEASRASKASLGDMSLFEAIAEFGDLAAAQTRITDFETPWGDAEATLRLVKSAAWGNVDAAADDALQALRADAPDAANVTEPPDGLQAARADPSRPIGAAGAPPRWPAAPPPMPTGTRCHARRCSRHSMRASPARSCLRPTARPSRRCRPGGPSAATPPMTPAPTPSSPSDRRARSNGRCSMNDGRASPVSGAAACTGAAVQNLAVRCLEVRPLIAGVAKLEPQDAVVIAQESFVEGRRSNR